MDVIDLFSGCGGLSLGFMKEGYTVKKAVEFDEKIANIYMLNHPEVDMIVDDIRNIDQSGVFRSGDADVIIGGPPCQGFSMAGSRIREGFIDDPRNYLFKHYFNVVKTVKPKVFVMENVKGIMTMQNGKIFEEIQRIFQDAEMLDGEPYHLYYRIVKAIEFGIPQKRERMIIIGTTIDNVDVEKLWDLTIEDMKKEYPTYFDKVTVEDAIGNMPSTTANREIANPVAPTITTRFDTPAGGRFIHPSENRTLTPREAARIQSFPDDFIFYGNKTTVCKTIGNAVPPKISFFLAKLVKKIIETEDN